MKVKNILFGAYAHIPVIIVLQVVFIILFGIFVVYNPENAIVGSPQGEGLQVYPMFQDVSVMIFIGFGFLMSFLKKYGLSAVSLSFLLSVLCVEWGTLVIGFFHLHHGKIYLDLAGMLNSEFAAATILISFGVVIGKTTPLQLIVMVLIEMVLFVVNEVIGRNMIRAIDAGDTIFVHLFGAYFGVACSFALQDKRVANHENQASRYNSDLFSMVGTIFLWIFWPSFNASTALIGGPQHRAILNTYYSLCACVVSTFAVSALTSSKKKFVMEHIQNATLAGGVAIGAAADMFVTPLGALIVGSVAGVISTLGFDYVTPFLNDKLRVHDTCGVHNLHGMPALFGSIISMIVAATASVDNYTEKG
uniref:Ammonium transporter AmtB-like domain-containing protein n=2 Tax=Lepeophtheirus salmonis TaxID=72036 RepID=A0A0K2TS92_LEPSM